MSLRRDDSPQRSRLPDRDALFVALVLAPGTFSRNKYFELFEEQELSRARRRAQLVRSLVKELTEPWPHAGAEPPGQPAVDVSERATGERTLISYRLPDLEYRRSAVLTALEVAALHYALERAGSGEVSATERRLVESTLARLDPRMEP